MSTTSSLAGLVPTKRAWVTASERASTAVGEERWVGSEGEVWGSRVDHGSDGIEREEERGKGREKGEVKEERVDRERESVCVCERERERKDTIRISIVNLSITKVRCGTRHNDAINIKHVHIAAYQ